MKHSNHSIQYYAGRHIVRLFTDNLSHDLLFHNFHHTANVVRGVRDIGKHLELTKEQMEILELAAWFHDSGFVETYNGHEAVSQKLAKEFLGNRNYPSDKIDQVLECIGATKMPQTPQNLLQEVICDADMYHLSLKEYIFMQDLLREEWKRVLGINNSDEEWHDSNLTFLENHTYFTSYGQAILNHHKMINISKFKRLLF